jgi:hypothetical protein
VIYISYFVQESPEGRKMLEFRRSLPSYKEKDALLTAIARNQVCQILFLFTSCMTQREVSGKGLSWGPARVFFDNG